MSTKPTVIKHGKPVSNHFAIFLPISTPVKVGQIFHCIDPRKNKTTKAQCVGFSTEHWTSISDLFCNFFYGSNASTLKKALEDSFPEHRNQENFKVLYLKELSINQ